MRSLTCTNPLRFLAVQSAFILVMLFLVLAAFGACADTGHAANAPAPNAPAVTDHHDRGDFLPGLPTWAIERIKNRGYGIYRMDARTQGWPTVADTIRQCLNKIEELSTIHWADATNDGNADVDLVFYMPDSYPNDGSAGSAYYTNAPAFINVNFRTGYSRWFSTYCHEIGHIHGEEDFYKHPLTCDTTVKWSVMSCGTGVEFAQALDRDLMRNVFIPDAPSQTWTYNDSRFVWVNWNGVRKSSVGCTPFAAISFNYPSTEKDNVCGHYSKYLDNVTQVSIFYRDNGGDWTFTGYYGNPSSQAGFAYRGFDRAWWCPAWATSRQWGVHPESAIPGTWVGWPFSISYLSGDIAPAGGC